MPTRRIEKLSNGTNAARQNADGMPSRSVQLLEVLLTDVELVALELDLRDAMFERPRRALDRLECALNVLEAVGDWDQASTLSAGDGGEQDSIR
jgi:hypothetical protein